MLTQARYDSKLASCTSMARKVLTFVPIQEPWSRAQIRTAMHHTTAATVDASVVDGCLSQLEEVGLVRRVGAASYQQVRPHAKPCATTSDAGRHTATTSGSAGSGKPANPQAAPPSAPTTSGSAGSRQPEPPATDAPMPNTSTSQPTASPAAVIRDSLEKGAEALDQAAALHMGMAGRMRAAIEATAALEATIEDLRRKCERYEALKSLLRDIDAP